MAPRTNLRLHSKTRLILEFIPATFLRYHTGGINGKSYRGALATPAGLEPPNSDQVEDPSQWRQARTGCLGGESCHKSAHPTLTWHSV